MYRNQYDTDCTTWSPQGRLHQVEYAMEAVKQGSACVGLRSDKLAVIAALKRSPNELAGYQKKLFKIDDHIGIGIAGLTADARSLAKHMRNECLNHKFTFNAPLVSGRLVSQVADMHQRCTHTTGGRRPYGVGLLIISHDEQTGPHLYQTCPSGNFYEYYGMAIGSRAQSGKTYLEKKRDEFAGSDADALCQHALKALQGCTQDKELTTANTSLAVVGAGRAFEIIEGEALEKYLEAISEEGGGGGAGAGAGAGAGGDDQMADAPGAEGEGGAGAGAGAGAGGGEGGDGAAAAPADPPAAPPADGMDMD